MINKKDSLINITEAEKKSFFRDGYHVINPFHFYVQQRIR